MSDLKPANERFLARAGEAGLAVEIVSFEKPSRTAEEAAAACACDVSQIVKSLVFTGANSGRAILLLVSGANRVDQDDVPREIGEPLARPDAAYVREVTGYAIGGIPPLGHDTAITTFADRDLMVHTRIWAAAGTPNSVFSVAPPDLMAAAGAQVIKLAGRRAGRQ